MKDVTVSDLRGLIPIIPIFSSGRISLFHCWEPNRCRHDGVGFPVVGVLEILLGDASRSLVLATIYRRNYYCFSVMRGIFPKVAREYEGRG